MKRFAVVGNPIAHSLSPAIHHCFAKAVDTQLIYDKVLSENLVAELPAFKKLYIGMNITVPFKFDAANVCDDFGHSKAGEDAKDAGAVNTLHFVNGRAIGYNTDGIGMIRDFAHHNVTLTGKVVLVIGAGGASAGILPALRRAQPKQIFIANRTLEKAKTLAKAAAVALSLDSLSDISSPDIIINTTSAGLLGETLAIPDSLFAQTEFIYDLSYDLEKPTKFLTETQKYDIHQADGYGMLIEQARESFHIWHGVVTTSNTANLQRSNITGINA